MYLFPAHNNLEWLLLLSASANEETEVKSSAIFEAFSIEIFLIPQGKVVFQIPVSHKK